MISIRQAGESDAELLAELNRFVHEVHFNRMPERFKPVETGVVSEWFRSKIQKPAVRIWIAESEGSAVGYLLTSIQDLPETPFRYRRVICHLDEISVVPGVRRMGVGKALVERAMADARARGIQDIEGDSWFFNTGAHELVLGLGFHARMIRFSRTLS